MGALATTGTTYNVHKIDSMDEFDDLLIALPYW